MLGGSVYSNPRYVREGYDYVAPGQMTAMVIGDTVATNSYSGTPYSHPSPVVPVSVESQPEIQDEQVSEQVTEKQQPLLIAVQEPESINETENESPLQNEQETLFTLEEGTTEVPIVTTTTRVPAKAPGRKIKTGKARKPTTTTAAPVANEEEDEEEESGVPANWPFGNTGRGGIPAYNAFFPIFIGGSSPSGRSRTRSANAEDAGGYPGSATAIANSFSTGKGGVATSHATSFGDPYAATMLRNAGLFNFRTKAVKKHAILEDE